MANTHKLKSSPSKNRKSDSESNDRDTSVEKLHYSDGDYIFLEGDQETHFYIVEKGHVVISTRTNRGERLEICQLGEGESFGEFALLDSKPRSASAQAVGQVTVIKVSEAGYHKLLSELPDWAISMMRGFIIRLKNMNELIKEGDHFVDTSVSATPLNTITAIRVPTKKSDANAKKPRTELTEIAESTAIGHTGTRMNIETLDNANLTQTPRGADTEITSETKSVTQTGTFGLGTLSNIEEVSLHVALPSHSRIQRGIHLPNQDKTISKSSELSQNESKSTDSENGLQKSANSKEALNQKLSAHEQNHEKSLFDENSASVKLKPVDKIRKFSQENHEDENFDPESEDQNKNSQDEKGEDLPIDSNLIDLKHQHKTILTKLSDAPLKPSEVEPVPVTKKP